MQEINDIMQQIQNTGFDAAIAIATDAEVQAGAAARATLPLNVIFRCNQQENEHAKAKGIYAG